MIPWLRPGAPFPPVETAFEDPNGLLAASEALRHGGVSVTARHYIENKQRSVLGFGHLLVDNERVVIPMDNASAAYGAA